MGSAVTVSQNDHTKNVDFEWCSAINLAAVLEANSPTVLQTSVKDWDTKSCNPVHAVHLLASKFYL